MIPSDTQKLIAAIQSMAGTFRTTGDAMRQERNRLKQLLQDVSESLVQLDPDAAKQIKREIDQIERYLFRAQKRYEETERIFHKLTDNINH